MYSTNLENPAWQSLDNRGAAAMAFLAMAAGVGTLAALSFFLLPLPTLQWFTDYWEHASAVRVLSEHVLAPTNPHYASYDSDRQFVPLFVMLGWLMKLTGMAVTTALAIGGVLTTLLFFVGVKMFADAYFRHQWAPAVLAAVLLCCWGTPWAWVGFYSLRAVFHSNFYPAAFVFSLTFITWALVIQALRNGAIALPVRCLLPFLSALMFVSHQLGGLFALGGAVLFLLFEPTRSTKTRIAVFLLLAIGVALTWWWPYFNPIELTWSGAGDKDNVGSSDFYNLIHVIVLLGPAWLGIPVLFELFRQRTQLALVAGFVGVFGVYFIGGMLEHPVAHRFLSFSVLYLHLPIVWKLLSRIPDRAAWPGMAQLKSDRPTYIAVALGLVLITLHIGLMSFDFARFAYERASGKSFAYYPYQQVVADAVAVTSRLPDDAIMFASPDPAMAITAFKGKVIARPRPQLMIADGAARKKDNARFFSGKTSQSERLELMRKYGARYILIKKNDFSSQIREELRALGEVVPTVGSLILIKVDTSAVP
jgi:hypothetical protein